MADDTSSNDRGSGAATQPGPARRPGLIRSIIHRLAGERPALPIEGHLASFAGATRLAQLGATDAGGTSPTRRRRRLLDLHLRQLAADVPLLRAWAAKYADAGLTIVGVHTPEFEFERNIDNVIAQVGTRRRVPGGGRQRLRRLARVLQPLLAGGLHRRRRGPHAVPPLRRGRVRNVRDGHPAAPARGRRDDVDQDLVFVDLRGLEVAADWRDPAVARDLPRLRPEHRLRLAGAARDSTAAPTTPAPAGCPSTVGPTGTWTLAQHAALLDEPGGRVAFGFQARDVNLVMGPAPGGEPIPFRVFLDGRPAVCAAGTDVDADGNGTVTDSAATS